MCSQAVLSFWTLRKNRVAFAHSYSRPVSLTVNWLSFYGWSRKLMIGTCLFSCQVVQFAVRFFGILNQNFRWIQSCSELATICKKILVMSSIEPCQSLIIWAQCDAFYSAGNQGSNVQIPTSYFHEKNLRLQQMKHHFKYYFVQSQVENWPPYLWPTNRW